MTEIAGFPFFPLPLRKDGQVEDAEARDRFYEALWPQARPEITDLFVVSHGWRNDAAAAMTIYRELFASARELINRGRGDGRISAVLGVFWPSKPWYEGWSTLAREVGQGRAAGAGPSSGREELTRRLDDFMQFFDEGSPERAKLGELRAQNGALDTTAEQRDFLDTLRSVLKPEPTDPDDDRADALMNHPADELFSRFERPASQPRPSRAAGSGGALGLAGEEGRAADAGGSGPLAAAARLVEKASYYEMKERAGAVGVGLNPILAEVRRRRPELRIHMVGHSFGARVVTAAVNGPEAFLPNSLTLLQAAFSHNAFSGGGFDTKGSQGFFRDVIAGAKVRGPIVVTHTVNDTAVGVAYPLASRVAGDNRRAMGDRNDPFGGLGRNGAVWTNEATNETMRDERGEYNFAPGRIYNLLADAYITGTPPGTDAHGDVRDRPVANVVLSAAGF